MNLMQNIARDTLYYPELEFTVTPSEKNKGPSALPRLLCRGLRTPAQACTCHRPIPVGMGSVRLCRVPGNYARRVERRRHRITRARGEKGRRARARKTQKHEKTGTCTCQLASTSENYSHDTKTRGSSQATPSISPQPRVITQFSSIAQERRQIARTGRLFAPSSCPASLAPVHLIV